MNEQHHALARTVTPDSLGTFARNSGVRLQVYASLSSTNDEAERLARAGAASPVWVVAHQQVQGRGRQGRVWSSPVGNLYSSLLLIDPCVAEHAPELGFVAGVSLAQALHEILPASVDAKLKWPNDVLIDGAKLAGMLLEAHRLADGRLACVVGIGVNCVSHPDGMAYRTTDLASVYAAGANASRLFGHLSDAIARNLELWNCGNNFAAIRAEWLTHCAGLGTRITVTLPRQTMSGIFETIDPTGRLVLVIDEGRQTIDAGDVLLPSLQIEKAIF